MTNILITGATGFVGANMVRKFVQDKHTISILARKESNFWRLQDIRNKIDVHVVDMSDKESLFSAINEIKPDIAYHLAAYGGYPFQQELNVIIQHNILASINFMSALEKYGNIRRVINFGSSSEYGPKSEPMKENDIAEPITTYGITKLAQTLFAKYFFTHHKLPIVTLRLFSVYGPFEEPGRLIYDIMFALLKKENLKLSFPSSRRDFIHVDDVIEAIQKATEIRDIDGEVFNIGTGIDYSIKDVVDTISSITDTKLKVSWGAIEKKRSFDMDTRWIADTHKTMRALNWKPSTSLKQGLLKTYQWYINNIEIYKRR